MRKSSGKTCQNKNLKLSEYVGKVLTGREVTDILDGMPLLKFMNDNDTHFGMTYKTGINVDVVQFNPNGKCCDGGIYLATLDGFVGYYNRYGSYARRAYLEDDAKVYVEHHKIKCDKVILEERKLKDDLLAELYCQYVSSGKIMYVPQNIFRNYRDVKSSDAIKNMLNISPHGIQYIRRKMRTDDLVKHVVGIDGTTLKHIDIKQRTAEINKIAVTQNGMALQYVPKELQISDIIRCAVGQTYKAFFLLDDTQKTQQIMKYVLELNGDAMMAIPLNKRTIDLMKIALKSNPNSIVHFSKRHKKMFQTQEICAI
jgi:hypothetical protein